MNANRSQSPCERVSVRGDKTCRERVCASQRPGGSLPPRSAVTRSRDWRLRSGPPECRGKPGGFPETPGNRICVGLRSGAGRAQTDNQPIMSLRMIVSKAAVGRLPRDLAVRTAVPSIRHRLRKHGHGGVRRADRASISVMKFPMWHGRRIEPDIGELRVSSISAAVWGEPSQLPSCRWPPGRRMDGMGWFKCRSARKITGVDETRQRGS